MSAKIEIVEIERSDWDPYIIDKEVIVGKCMIGVDCSGVCALGEFLLCLAYVDDIEAHVRKCLNVKKVRQDQDLVRKVMENIEKGAGKIMLVGSSFERAVWKVLLDIPDGKTVSYQWVADRVGKPKAVRAVARAVGRNPIAYWVPCHRVVRSDGGMGGYAYGLEIKQRLLDLEKANCAGVLSMS